MKNQALFAAGMVFVFFALIHLMRVFFPFPVIIGSFSVPIWMSGIVFVLIGAFASWILYAMGSKND